MNIVIDHGAAANIVRIINLHTSQNIVLHYPLLAISRYPSTQVAEHGPALPLDVINNYPSPDTSVLSCH